LALAELIKTLRTDQALALGAMEADLPDTVDVVTKRDLAEMNGAAKPAIIARSAKYLYFRPKQPAVALLDYDTKGMPPDVAAKLDRLGGFWSAIVSVCPDCANVARVVRRSTSAGLFLTDTREQLAGSDGMHIFVSVKDGTDIDRFLKALHARCCLFGLGWMMVGASGQMLERSIVDRVVGSPERLVFEGPPVLKPPLAQDADSRRPVVIDGKILDTTAACQSLTIVEKARLKDWRAGETQRLSPDSAKVRKRFIDRKAKALAERTGMDAQRAAKMIERECAGVLSSEIALPFDDQDLAGTTVAEVLADPERFDGETLADPLEGPDYGVCKAKIMRHRDGSPWIHSFAHGRTLYELRYSFEAAKAAIEKDDGLEAADAFVKVVLFGDLDAVETESLRNLAVERARVGKRAINQKLKSARQEQQLLQLAEKRNRRICDRQDLRPQILAPLQDAPWREQMDVLNEVMGAANDPEPPARDIDGFYVKVRVRRALNMHCLTSGGSNAEETPQTRIPAPEQPLLTRLAEAQLAEELDAISTMSIRPIVPFISAVRSSTTSISAPTTTHCRSPPPSRYCRSCSATEPCSPVAASIGSAASSFG
jgi:hypothetical protein